MLAQTLRACRSGAVHTSVKSVLQPVACIQLGGTQSLVADQSAGRSSFIGAMAGLVLPQSAGFVPDYRMYSSEADSGTSETPVGNEKVQKLAEEIAALSVLECSWLTQILRKKLGIERSAMSMMPMMSAGPAAAPAAPADEAPKEEKKEEKKEFDVKLESYGADAKIKVIKEVRALTNLGLKEAKELVEKAPVVIKGALSKPDAEAMLKQLAAVGAKVVLE